MKTTKINNVKIEPLIDNNKRDPKRIIGYDMFPEPYSNIFIQGRKASGKTNCLYRCMENCVQKGTDVMIFASSVNNDKTYAKMKKMLKDKKCNVKAYTHFIDDNGVDLIEQWLKLKMTKEDAVEDKRDVSVEDIPSAFADFGQYDYLKKNEFGKKIKKKTAEKKNKKICPETIMIFDDLADLLRHNSLARLVVRNRHFLLKTFILGHSIVNLSPMALRMIDTFILFPNLSEERIFELADKVGIDFKNDTKRQKKLYQIYCHATSKPYNFLCIDRNNMTYRKNFDEEYEIQE
jgi:hypothetical protein